MRIKLLAILLILPLVSRAATVTLTTTQTDSPSSITTIVTGMSPGDILQFPVGTFNWSGKGGVTVTKNIHILGAGMGQTTITAKNAFSITTAYVAAAGTVTTPEFRISGFTFISDQTETYATNPGSTVYLGGLSQNVRVDNIAWKNYLSSNAFWLYGWVFGVMDHCTVDAASGPANELIIINHSTSPDGSGQFGDFSWTLPADFGTAKEFYVEDCIFLQSPFSIGTLGGTTGGGARYVFRHNSTTAAGGGGHGTETNGRGRSLRATESYNNHYQHTGTGGESSMNYRGGTGNVFNNRYTAYSSGQEVSVENYRTGANFSTFNSGDGTGPWDNVDRSANGPKGTGTGVEDGSGDTRHSYVYATGTGGTISGNTVTLGLGVSISTADGWKGYTLRNVTKAIPGITGSGTNYFGLISGNPANGNTVTVEISRGGTMTLVAGDTWEIRHVFQWLDAPGTGAQNTLVTGPSNAPVLVSGTPNPRWTNQPREGIYQWGNKIQSTTTDAWTTPAGFTVWGSNPVNNGALVIGRDLFNDNVRPSYPVISSPTATQLRIGADWTLPGAPVAINVGDTGAATQAWGWTYPHPLVSGTTSQTITSSATTTFNTSGSGSFQFTSSNFTGTPTWSKTGTLPSGVTLSSAGLLSGTPGGGTVDYPITVTALHAASGGTATQDFVLKVSSPNVNPTISITAPVAGSQGVAPKTIVIQANPADTDGIITKVEFFNGTTLLGDTSVSPWSYTWTAVPAGTHSLTAKAFDNSTGITTSDPVVISLTAPAGGATPPPPTIKTVTP